MTVKGLASAGADAAKRRTRALAAYGILDGKSDSDLDARASRRLDNAPC